MAIGYALMPLSKPNLQYAFLYFLCDYYNFVELVKVNFIFSAPGKQYQFEHDIYILNMTNNA